MANPVSPIDLSEPLSVFLAKVVSDGTYADVIETEKTDEPGEEAPASAISVASGQLWSNVDDDMFKLAYQALHKAEKVWRVADATARDALGSTNGLLVDDIVFQISDASLHYCTAVLGPASSTWSPVGTHPVDSVFGRTGAVVAAASDYDASQVDNDSGVAGADVAAALDVLDAAISGAGGVPAGIPHADSVVFYVDLANSGSYPGSGGTVTDTVGNATNGSLDGGLAVANGAAQFDNTAGKKIGFDKNAALDDVFLGGATVMSFFQCKGNPTASGRFASTDTGTTGWVLFVDPVFGNDGIRGQFVRRSNGGTDGNWTGSADGAFPVEGVTGGGFAYGSVAVTYDETVLSNDPTFYLNGQSGNTPGGTNPSALGSDAGTELTLGADPGGTFPLNGQQPITIIWSRILTAEEIQQVHNLFMGGRLTRTGSPSAIVALNTFGAAGGAQLIRGYGLEQPTIVDGTSGCINFQCETSTGKGITSSGIDRAAILSGQNNQIHTNGDLSLICGGSNNIVGRGSSVIVGGSGHEIGASGNSFIGGGASNLIAPVSGTSEECFIGCGFQNRAYDASYGGIVSGRSNELGRPAGGSADYAAIGGGRDNNLHRGLYAVIAGGQGNKIGETTGDASHSWIPGGQNNEVDLADWGNAAGRQSKCRHQGATIHSDSQAQDEESNRINQHKRVYQGGFAERTTLGFGGSGTDPGEAPERFNEHVTTADATPATGTIGTLSVDQRTMMFEVEIHSIQDAGANARFEKFMVTAYRTGGTVTAAGTSIAFTDVGATGVTYTFGATGDNIEVTITGVAAENWQHTLRFVRQQGGLTA